MFKKMFKKIFCCNKYCSCNITYGEQTPGERAETIRIEKIEMNMCIARDNLKTLNMLISNHNSHISAKKLNEIVEEHISILKQIKDI